MKISILWEDQRAGGGSFGPDVLLKSCIADDRNEAVYGSGWRQAIQSIPKKGKEKVFAALKEDLEDLSRNGPVVAVLDLDKAHELCGLRQRPDCKSEILKPFHKAAPGDYELVLLEDHLETLVLACCAALPLNLVRAKPKPDERDEILKKLAFHPDREKRKLVRKSVPSFDRLVRKIGEQLNVYSS